MVRTDTHGSRKSSEQQRRALKKTCLGNICPAVLLRQVKLLISTPSSSAVLRNPHPRRSARRPCRLSFPGQEARLNLGALATDSQEPVISAYLAGLLRSPSKTLPAADYHGRHRPNLSAGPPRGSSSAPRSKHGAPPRRPSRIFRKLHPAGLPPTPLWSWQPLPPRVRSPPGLATTASLAGAATISCAGAGSIPRVISLRRDECASSTKEQQRRRRRRGWTRHGRCKALSGGAAGDNHGGTTVAGHPEPPATAPSGTMTAAATADMRRSGRARSAPERPTTPPSRHHHDRGRGTGRWYQRPDWYEDRKLAPGGGDGCSVAACRRGQQEPPQKHVEPPGYGGDCCRRDYAESFLLCRGWGKMPKKPTPRLTGGGSVDVLAAPSPSPPDGASHGLGGGCRTGLEADGRSQQELIPPNMFLTRTHRRGHRMLAPPA